jgi:tripartite-type tricarboxylate transporter receptor subunit TctC
MGIVSKCLSRLALATTVAALLSTGAAHAQSSGAQSYPNKSVRIIVPYPAGGATDALGRMIGQKLEAAGQTVVVENRVGASGIIGNEIVAKAPADGHTILIGITTLIQAPYLYQKLPYDAFQAFAPVSQIALSADLFIVPTIVPANSLKEFVQLVKSNPKKYNFGSYGNATSSHIHGEMLNKQAGLDLTHVAYKGAAPLVTDLLGGQLTSGFVDVGSVRQHLKSGKLKVLAVSGAQRFKIFPDIPTFTELGYEAFEPYGWFGVLVPAATPKDIVKKLSAEVARIVRLPEASARIEDLGLQIVGNTPEEFAASMKADAPVWAKVIKDANIRID